MADDFDANAAVAAYLGGAAPTPETALRTTLQDAVTKNPDKVANWRRTAATIGVPLDTAEALPDWSQQQGALAAIDTSALARMNPVTTAFLTDSTNAGIAHDDTANMGLIETMVSSFRRGVPGLQQFAAATAVGSNVSMLDQFDAVAARIDAGEKPTSILAADDPMGVAFMTPEQRAKFRASITTPIAGNIGSIVRTQKERQAIAQPAVVNAVMQSKTFKEAIGAFLEAPVQFIASIGPESLVANGPGLLAAIPATIYGGPAAGASVLGAGSFATDYGSSVVEALTNAGVNVADPVALQAAVQDKALMRSVVSQAMAHATVVGAVDGLSGGIASKFALPKAVATKLATKPVARELANVAAQVPVQGAFGGLGEAGGELAAGQELQPGNILAEIVGETFSAPAEVGSIAGGAVRERISEARAANAAAARVEELTKLADASKLRARDPETFKAFVEQAGQAGTTPTELFINAETLANTLNQSGITMAELQAIAPSVAQQMQAENYVPGADLRIPVSELLAAPSEISATLVDHLRESPDAMSRAEAADYLTTQGDKIRQEVEQELGRADNREAYQQQVDQVRDQFQAQLDAAGRFRPEVNKAYATLLGNFYAAQAQRAGMPVADMMNLYQLGVQAKEVAGWGRLDQAALVKAQEEIRGLLAQVAQEGNASQRVSIAPVADWLVAEAEKQGLDITGYSHAIDSSAVRHTRKQHGDEKKEASRGQIAVKDADFELIPEVVENPDTVIFGTKNRLHKEQVVYLKAMPDGSTLYLEEVRTGKKELAAVTMRRYPATTSAESIVSTLSPNAQGDGGNGVIVVNRPETGNSVAQGARGALSFGADITQSPSVIALLKGADLSTFIHESGHFFLEVQADLAARIQGRINSGEEVSAGERQIVADMDTLLASFGISATPEQTALTTWLSMSLEEKREHHETFARGFERYAMEGNAPTQGLQEIFQRFRAWLVQVYKTLKGLNVELTDEVRQVLDRMLASDQAIQQAQDARNMGPLFESAKKAGMTPEEYADYQALGQRATDTATAELDERLIKDMKWMAGARLRALKARQKEVAALRTTTRNEVTREVMAQPIYQAWQFLTGKGEKVQPGKVAAEDIDSVQASGRLRTSLVKEMDEFSAETLIRRKMTSENEGMHPDIVAELFGFSSGDELVAALAAAETPAEVIDQLTDQRMLEQHGDITSQAALERAAEEAIHNQVRARVIATELKALTRSQEVREGEGRSTVNVMARAAKNFAAQVIARTKIKDLRPKQYSAAEARSAKLAVQSLGKVDEAAMHKRNQLVNNYAARAASDAQAEVTRGAKYLDRVSRADLPAEYREQIEAILERFDIRQSTSLKTIERRKSLAQWVESQRDVGIEPDISEAMLNESLRVSVKDLTVEEFRGLIDTVKQIEHLGRLKDKLLTAKDQRAFSAVKAELIASIGMNSKGRTADARTPTTKLGKWFDAVKGFGAAHIKTATWARIMDGGKDGGPMWERFIRGANEAGDQETTMRAAATTRLTEIMAPVLKAGKMGGKGKFFPSVGKSFNRESVLVMALNTGNASNLQRLLGGEGWTMQQLQPILDTVTATEWAAVQEVWDHFESYRPLIGAKERRVFGKEPEWIDPTPVVTATAGTLKGGYYPVKYDPAASVRAEEHADAEEAKQQLKGAYSAATTRRSFTKSRVEEVAGRPLLYTLSGMYGGINDVIHDLAWHEWLIDTNRLLKSRSLDEAIRGTYGPTVVRQFKTWRDAVAVGDSASQEAVDVALSRLRQGVSISGLGFNLMSAMMQPLGLTQSIVRVGGKWIGKGVMQYIGAPIAKTREANAKSDFMANRARTRFRELNELRNRVEGQTVVRERINASAYVLMVRFQQLVDVPTWHGAYEKAIASGRDEEGAIALADQAVIDAQGGGQTKDLSAIERGGPAQKLFTVFYSFMNTALNIGVAQGMTNKNAAKTAADFVMLYSVPAILGALLKDALTPGDAGDDDPEKLFKKLAAEQLGFLFGLFVVGREFGEAAKTVAGMSDRPRDYAGPAGVRLVTDTYALGKQINQGEFDDSFRKAVINVTGELFGLPAAQINRAITGAQALSEGKTSNPAALVLGFQEPR